MPVSHDLDLSIRTVQVIRYVAPLREGGSMPGIVEADDWGTYVLKFIGAGQGEKVLIAELVCAQIGRIFGLPIPEIVFAELDSRIGRNEADPEIQDLITGSAGLNLAIDYLPGAFAFDAQDVPDFDSELASAVVWFDAFMSNVDRTARNTNMLIWGGRPWLIDHGAALYAHFSGAGFAAKADSRFPQIRDHVLLSVADQINQVDERMSKMLSREVTRNVVAMIPDDWLTDPAFRGGPDEQREEYVAYLTARLEGDRAFVKEAIDARAQLV